jgi:Arc/MetJ-type ribon-helix-helix transcriptional regulator
MVKGPPDEGQGGADLIWTTRHLFAAASEALRDAIRRLESGAGDPQLSSERKKIALNFQKTLLTLLELQSNIEKRSETQLGSVGRAELDLDAARQEIARRVALLRSEIET